MCVAPFHKVVYSHSLQVLNNLNTVVLKDCPGRFPPKSKRLEYIFRRYRNAKGSFFRTLYDIIIPNSATKFSLSHSHKDVNEEFAWRLKVISTMGERSRKTAYMHASHAGKKLWGADMLTWRRGNQSRCCLSQEAVNADSKYFVLSVDGSVPDWKSRRRRRVPSRLLPSKLIDFSRREFQRGQLATTIKPQTLSHCRRCHTAYQIVTALPFYSQ